MTQEQSQPFKFSRSNGTTLLIACGALGKEIIELIEVNHWHHLSVTCLPAHWHHTPGKIPEGLRVKIRENKEQYDKIYVVYGDCGTGGAIDKVLEEEGGIERISGPHCFSFFNGNIDFADRADAETTTFYLTDFFCQHFDKFVWQALGLDRRDDMLEFVFGNYQNLVYLSQARNPELENRAKSISERLRLNYEYRFCGYGDLEPFMKSTLSIE